MARMQKAQARRDALPSLLAGAASILIYPATIFAFLHWVMSKDAKQEIIGWLEGVTRYIHGLIFGPSHPTIRIFLLSVYMIALVLGIGTLMVLELRRFTRTETFDVPYIGKPLQIPPIKNYYYIPAMVAPRELAAKLKSAERDLATLRQQQDALSRENQELSQRLVSLVSASQALQQEADHYTDALQEMYRLLGYVQALLSCEVSEYPEEFRRAMDEVATTLVRVTSDKGNDTYSSIMMVNPESALLEIVGSNGLSHESRSRTFRKGQGFAGWIWERGQPDVCPDIAQDGRFEAPDCKPSGPYRSIIGLPILDSGQEVIGALFVQSRRTASFHPSRDTAVLSYFAKLLAICITDKTRREIGP